MNKENLSDELRIRNVFEEETGKLDFRDRSVSYKLRQIEPYDWCGLKIRKGFAARMSDRTYEVVIPLEILIKSDCRVRSLFKEELYYIAAGHVDQGSDKPLSRALINELEAKLYRYMGINICGVASSH